MTIDTVTFDVWNTLLVHEFYDDRLKNHRMESIRDALRGYGHDFSWEQISGAYDYTEECLSRVWKTERDLSNDSHLILFLEGLGLDHDDNMIEVIREPYSHALLHFRPKLVDGAGGLIKSLKEKGYRIGLISNTGRTPGRTMRRVLEDYGLLDSFAALTFSDEAGYIKPGAPIFRMALAGLRTSPENTVHIGDHPLLDVYGARSAGIKSILFTRYAENFQKYASKYYSANGRSAEPDAVVDSLTEVEDALVRLGGK